MIIDIPQQNPLRQINKDDVSGSLHETFNIDLEAKKGKICLPLKTRTNVTSDEDSNIGLINQFLFGLDRWYALSAGSNATGGVGAKLLRSGGDSIDDGFALPTWTGNTTDFNDDAVAIFYNNDIIYHSSDTWSLGTTSDDTSFTLESTSGGNSHALIFNDRVYILNGFGNINSYIDPANISTNGSYTFNISTMNSYEIVGMDKTSSSIWIATSHADGGYASLFTWDGVTEDIYDAQYEIPESYIMALKVMDNIPYIVTGSGKLMAFNGSAFEELDRFPFENILLNQLDISRMTNWSEGHVGRWIHFNGITIINGKLLFLVNPLPYMSSDALPDTFGDFKPLSGIWCYDKEIGLYHKYAISLGDTNGEQAILKRVGAIQSASIDINTGEYPLLLFSVSYTTSSSLNSNVEKYLIGYLEYSPDESISTTGYAVTQRIYAQNIQDTWEKVCVGFEEMNIANYSPDIDKIEIKYRTIQKQAYNATITWTSATTFTSTNTDLQYIKSNFDNGVKYEIRILYGSGSGVISQMTNITESGGTYTITVPSNEIMSISGTGCARFENWILADTITSAENDIQFKQIPIGKDSNWIQYKFVLTGRELDRNEHSPAINRIVSVSNQHTKFQ